MAELDLGKQIGPLPLGAWIVVVGGGLGIALYTRNAPAPEIVEDTSTDPGVGTGPGWVAVPPPSTAPPTQPPPETNEEWGRQAINYLIASGYPAGISDNAIRKYLEAGKLDPQEWAILQIALVKFGSPPIPIPNPPPVPNIPGPVTPKPPTTQPPKPPAPKPPPPSRPTVRYVTVGVWPAWNSTLSGIAKRYYGRPDWERIYNANRSKIRNPNLIFPGQRLVVP